MPALPARPATREWVVEAAWDCAQRQMERLLPALEDALRRTCTRGAPRRVTTRGRLSEADGRVSPMDFTIFDGDGTTETRFSGDDSYRFDAHGLLEVTRAGVKTTYSPRAWSRLVRAAETTAAYVY